MKRIKFFLLGGAAILVTQLGFAQTELFNAEDEIKQLQTEIQELKKSLQDKENKLVQTSKDVNFLIDQKNEIKNKLDSVESKLEKVNITLAKTIDGVNKSLGIKIEATSNQISKNKASADKSFHFVLVYGIAGLLLAIIITIVIFYILRKRIGEGDVDLNAVKEANKKLAEQSIALDNRLAEVLEHQLNTDESIKNISSQAGKSETDHSLVLSIANEMMRIEQNLSFMDPKTKGVSQLKNRAAAIAAALSSKGYEVPNLINTEYKEGMNYEALMEEDEDMEPGVMRIKRVTQPCVMYKGKMIQTAKVVVAYNPEETE